MLWITPAALPSPSTAQLNVVSPAAAGAASARAGRGCAERHGALGEVVLVEQVLGIDVHVLGVGQVAVAVLEGDRGRAHEPVDVGHGVAGQGGDVEVVEQPEDLQRGEALRVRRRGERGPPAVTDAQRRHPVGAVRGEVVGAQHAAVAREERADLVRDGALVEGGATALGDGLERVGQARACAGSRPCRYGLPSAFR